ncbi:MAG: hypothetical protein UY07_C0016G0005 [Parcubacteria group bacterium GW2011_GWA1_47_8]|nr:MAG: hypothetical protein UY07_C0016G0005 [Parcubacteria group bacterium GW2011_GWA1_47_8]KKW07702.1 MAG: hypothetical protein UY42_C0008G0005 [Parcubacteria group bacterium GW2011_GWA2_49_16]
MTTIHINLKHVTIRPLRDGDRDELMSLMLRLKRRRNKNINPIGELFSWQEAEHQGELKGEFMVISYRLNGKNVLIGIGGIATGSTLTEEKVAFITHVDVDRRFKWQILARVTMERLFARAISFEASRVILIHCPVSDDARTLYHSFGFTIDSAGEYSRMTSLQPRKTA